MARIVNKETSRKSSLFFRSLFRKGNGIDALKLGVVILAMLSVFIACLVWFHLQRLSEEAQAEPDLRPEIPSLPDQSPSISGEGMLVEAREEASKNKSRPSAKEMPFALPTPGNPLSVTLPGGHASLGEISVEKYSKDGKPTGLSLPRGTPVQIPDPSRPGEAIYFKVP